MKSIVEYKAKSVSPESVRKRAEDLYREGFFCCEAVVSAIRSEFEVDVPEEVIAMASGMSVGVGRSGCLCGAVNGGVLALGMFFGRTEPLGPHDPSVNYLMNLTNELHTWFRDNNGKHSTCCRVLTREFDMGQGEHKEQCIRFTGMCAFKVAEILCRELGILNEDE